MINLNKNVIDEIIKDVINNFIDESIRYDMWSNHSTSIISEGLIFSYSPNKLNKILNNRYNLKELGIKLAVLPMTSGKPEELVGNIVNKQNRTNNDFNELVFFKIMFINGFNVGVDIIKDIIHTMESCGWFLSHIDAQRIGQIYKEINNDILESIKNLKCSFIFEPKFSTNISKKNLPPFCYHIAPTRVVEKILKQGLTPRDNGRVANHDERVYLFINKPNNWHYIADRFRESGMNEPYAILSIDMSKISNNTMFYQDTNVMTNNPAIYTYEPIPPNSINQIDSE